MLVSRGPIAHAGLVAAAARYRGWGCPSRSIAASRRVLFPGHCLISARWTETRGWTQGAMAGSLNTRRYRKPFVIGFYASTPAPRLRRLPRCKAWPLRPGPSRFRCRRRTLWHICTQVSSSLGGQLGLPGLHQSPDQARVRHGAIVPAGHHAAGCFSHWPAGTGAGPLRSRPEQVIGIGQAQLRLGIIRVGDGAAFQVGHARFPSRPSMSTR